MESSGKKWTMHDRVVATLKGEKPDRPPFIDRLETWYGHHNQAGTMPVEYQGMSLNEVHRATGFGQQKFVFPYGLRLRGVEVISVFEGETIYHETDPVVELFPSMYDMGVADRPGTTSIDMITPVGRLRVQHEIVDSMIRDGELVYTKEHPMKGEEDYRTVEYIIERAEYVPLYEKFHRIEAEVGDIGFVIAALHHVPFQQMLLEYLGEVPWFYMLHDNPKFAQRVMALLDEQLTEILHHLAGFSGLYVEFPDNLHGLMTNPKLFEEHCLPYYQRYADIVHGQGKKLGTHGDGDMKPLLGLLAESGLDVLESFAPAPLTSCTFEEAWNAWRDGPIIWGGIPSPILEARTSESDFRDYVSRVLGTAGDQPIIWGVSDLVLGINSIERVRYIVDQIESQAGG